MNDNLKTALDELYNDESAKFLIGDQVKFSPEFEKKMEKLLPKKKPKISVKKHAFKIVMISAAAAALFGISLTAGAAVTRGFTVTEGFDKFWKNPTIKFSAARSEDNPKTIEKYYTPTVFPEGKEYAYYPSIYGKNTMFFANYTSTEEAYLDQPFGVDRDLRFWQYTKEAFSIQYSTPEYVDISETKINGCPAYRFSEEHYFGYENTVIWDNGDYIFVLWGNVPLDELIRAAESVDVNENALEEGQT